MRPRMAGGLCARAAITIQGALMPRPLKWDRIGRLSYPALRRYCRVMWKLRC